MKHTLLFATIASFVVVHAYANNIVTSKTYVDGRDALKVDIAQGTGDNNANVGKTLVVNASGNLELGTPAATNYVEDSITDGVTTKAPSEDAVHDALEAKQDTIDTAEVDMNGFDLPALVSYDTTNGLVGNRIGILDQETIDDDEGDLFVYDDPNYPDGEMDNYVPTVRTVANSLRNIWNSMPSPLRWNSNDATAVNNYSTSFTGTGNWPSAHEDRYVTGNSLAQGLALKQNRQIGAAPVGNANSTDAGKVLVVSNDGKIAMGTTTVSNFQTKIPATEWQYGYGGNAPIPGVVISTDVDGAVEQRMILDKTQDIQDSSIDNLVNNGYDDSMAGGIAYDIHDNSVTGATVEEAVPTTMMTVAIAKSAANQATSNKQNKIPARATKIESTDSTYAQSVVTNGTTDGSVGQMAILTSARVGGEDGADGNEFADYTNADNLIPTAAAVRTELSYKQARKFCAGWPDGVEHTDANCWLWNMPD